MLSKAGGIMFVLDTTSEVLRRSLLRQNVVVYRLQGEEPAHDGRVDAENVRKEGR